ncbi:MAG: thiol:disulfide interchange protein, partial [Muribaculaceae bacterium]|nr:thiol:disulfide interchange protein [Muribaculaceae bacterium]
MKKNILSLLFVLVPFLAVMAAPAPQHVVWSSEVEKVSPTEGILHITADIESGWHIYGSEMPVIQDMPTYPTTVSVNPTDGLVLDGAVTPSVPQKSHYDEMMALELPWWEGKVTFSQKFHIVGVKGAEISGTISYMACNATACTPPTPEDFAITFGDPAPVTPNATVPDRDNSVAETQAVSMSGSSLWDPVDESINSTVVPDTKSSSLWSIFLFSFLGGLLALLTPCVWPMIPMTVSFFLKTTKSRRKAIVNAITYGVSIVVIFLVLGLAITAIFGASKLNELSTSAVFNLLFFALLVVFAISFFGAFDIKLPSKWSNAIDSKAESTSGFLSIFFMAFTLVLVSFSCTGPIIGTLLVEAASEGNIVGPAVGMGGCSLGLAVPFALG